MLLRCFSIFLLIGLVLGCNRSSEDTNTYFGGEIINPKENFIVLLNANKVIDTFYLDQNNRFLEKLEVSKEALFYFQHGSENQYVYIEPQDSILIRLNTWDFDESLVFSGKGGERNNMLLNCFLQSEQDEEKIFPFYSLSPVVFKQKMDSILSVKQYQFEEFIAMDSNETFAFHQLLNIALTYPVYAKMEGYPFHLSKANSMALSKIHQQFYSYRNDINIRKDSLLYFHAYRDFMVSYMYNLAFSNNTDNQVYSSRFTSELLKIISQKIKTEDTKNTFLKKTIISYFYKTVSEHKEDTAFDTFFKLSSSQKNNKNVQALLVDSKKLLKYKKIPNFSVVDFNNAKKDSRSIFDQKKTVLSFWNPSYTSKAYIASKINYFNKKYPEIQFIVIQIGDSKKQRIEQLDIKTQFFIDSESNANSFLTSKMPRTILMNEKGIITESFTALSSKKIYTQVASLMKRD